MRQHFLGVVDNVIHCFVAHLSDFPVAKQFWKSVKMWWNYRHSSVACFFETWCS